MSILSTMFPIHINHGYQITVDNVPDVTKDLRAKIASSTSDVKAQAANSLSRFLAGLTNAITGKVAPKGQAPVNVPLTHNQQAIILLVLLVLTLGGIWWVVKKRA